MRSDSSNF